MRTSTRARCGAGAVLGNAASTASLIMRPDATSTGCPVKKQTTRESRLRNRLGCIRLSRECSESETKRVRSDAKSADITSSELGPPMRIGGPFGTAITTDEGRRTGSEQLISISPNRTALVPITETVFDPNTHTASSSGLTGLPGFGVSPGRITGLGVFGKGAHATPGGIRMCPGTCFAFAPVLVAGTPQNSTGPRGGRTGHEIDGVR